MTDHADAVRVAAEELRYARQISAMAENQAADVVAALTRAGLLARPGELAALRVVAEATRLAIKSGGFPELTDALVALSIEHLTPPLGSPSGSSE